MTWTIEVVVAYAECRGCGAIPPKSQDRGSLVECRSSAGRNEATDLLQAAGITSGRWTWILEAAAAHAKCRECGAISPNSLIAEVS